MSCSCANDGANATTPSGTTAQRLSNRQPTCKRVQVVTGRPPPTCMRARCKRSVTTHALADMAFSCQRQVWAKATGGDGGWRHIWERRGRQIHPNLFIRVFIIYLVECGKARQGCAAGTRNRWRLTHQQRRGDMLLAVDAEWRL
eukprot:362070-Chlamydomonas_euryale.AAC.17